MYQITWKYWLELEVAARKVEYSFTRQTKLEGTSEHEKKKSNT